MNEEVYAAKRTEMIRGFFGVMLLASETEVDGERHAYINASIAVDAIEHLLAAIVESSPEVKTRKDIRHATEAIEKRVRMGVESLRKTYIETGMRPFPSFNAN